MLGGIAILREVLKWWARQICTLLPPWLLPDASKADALIATTESQWIRFTLRHRRRETPLGRFRLDEGGQRAAKEALRPRMRRVILRPDTAAVLERKVLLPIAAEHDVTRVLCYEMDRFTPFNAEQVLWSATIERRDRGIGQLEVSLTVLPKQLIQPVLNALEGIGLKVSAIEAPYRNGSFRVIDLVPPSSRRRRLFSLAWGGVAALAFVAIVTPFRIQSLASAEVEARITDLQPRIAQVETLRGRLAAGAAGNDVIATEQARSGDALQVLATITDLLPDDTVLSDLSLRQGKLSIAGRSRVAPELIPAMAAEPMLHNPSFAAPVTRTQDGKADTFVIRAELNP